nr:molybdopterin cofactor-binding domain-containing protein [Aliikangiella sp. G2MR2-5]
MLSFSVITSASEEPGSEADAELSPYPFLSIDDKGRVTYFTTRSDLGQGSITGICLIIADELGVEPDDITVDFKSPQERHWVGTGGSSGTYSVYRYHRPRIAAVRQLLINAAAKLWQVSSSQCEVSNGYVCKNGTEEKVSYGQLVALAKMLELPDEKAVEVFEPDKFRWIGKSRRLNHIASIVTGEAKYGIDIELPEMLFASIERCPYPRGSIRSFDLKAAKASPGVVEVTELKGSGWEGQAQYRPTGIAVIAKSAWQAQQAREKLSVEWKCPQSDLINDASIDRYYSQKLKQAGVVVHQKGDYIRELSLAEHKLDAVYKTPYWNHAPLEPMNATAVVNDSRCEVWSGCHLQTILQTELMELLGFESEQVIIHTPLIGGSFGRRLYRDYAIEAVLLAQKIKKPIQVLFNRLDESKHGQYMPAAHIQMTSGIRKNEKNTPFANSLHVRAVQASNESQRTPETLKDGKDPYLQFDPLRIPYEFENLHYEQCYTHEMPVPTGYWRGTYGNNYCFAFESWIDELAIHLKQDRLDYRLSLLENDKELYPKVSDDAEQLDKKLAKRVIKRAAELADWRGNKSAGQGRGIAWCWSFFYSYAAAVADVSVSSKKEITVNKITIVIDCGIAVNPNMIKAQLEGGVIWALSAMQTQVHFEAGKVVNNSFADYPVLNYSQCPPIEVDIISSQRPASGVGEIGNMPIFAAVCNAIYDAIGVRVRELPLKDFRIKAT